MYTVILQGNMLGELMIVTTDYIYMCLGFSCSGYWVKIIKQALKLCRGQGHGRCHNFCNWCVMAVEEEQALGDNKLTFLESRFVMIELWAQVNSKWCENFVSVITQSNSGSLHDLFSCKFVTFCQVVCQCVCLVPSPPLIPLGNLVMGNLRVQILFPLSSHRIFI